MNRGFRPDPNDRAIMALIHVLPRKATVEPVAVVDGEEHFMVNGTPLRVVWIGEGRLPDVRAALSHNVGNPDMVIVARKISPGAQKLLSEEGVGWVDETGAAEIALGPILISRTGRPPEASKETTRWTPSVFAVAEALLCGVRPTVADAMAETGLSRGGCQKALRFLTKLELLDAAAKRGRHSARELRNPGRLLDVYAAAVSEGSPPLSIPIGVSWRDPVATLSVIGQKWDAIGVKWACTGGLAASILAPFLSEVTSFEVYIEGQSPLGLESAALDAGLQILRGGRMTLSRFPTTTSQRLSTQANGLRLAPWPRVYADLSQVGVRGEEAAEHLREVMDAGGE